ncbi:A-kinase-interacting protein 1 isoform X2 [Hyperolius riggenbachi]|uniref:A-kinase-interacting protein 1 isoform X2 n=1 Tax=Hyperolius riggenbachi TaxID=752182 RepID=UPI0035A30694
MTRRACWMESHYGRMEESLRRTSELATEVLERARRREVDWWASRGQDEMGLRNWHGPEDGHHVTLEEAFSTMAHFMRHTTEQCETYHSCIPPHMVDNQERQHIGRFHHRRPRLEMQRVESRLSSPSRPMGHSGVVKTDPRDVYIEVAPGTYSISARSPHSPAQTHIVNITPGQSVDVTFNI